MDKVLLFILDVFNILNFKYVYAYKSNYIIICNNLFYYNYIMLIRYSSIIPVFSFIDFFVYSVGMSNTVAVCTFVYKFDKILNFFIFNKGGVYLSIYSLFPGCVWYEREAHELLGAYFSNLYDLRNLLMPYCFTINPLLKKMVKYSNITIKSTNVLVLFNWVYL